MEKEKMLESHLKKGGNFSFNFDSNGELMLFETNNKLTSTFAPQTKYFLPYSATGYKIAKMKKIKLRSHNPKITSFNDISPPNSTNSSKTSRETASTKTKGSAQPVAKLSPLPL